MTSYRRLWACPRESAGLALLLAFPLLAAPAGAQTAQSSANRSPGPPRTHVVAPPLPVLDPYPAVTTADSVMLTGTAPSATLLLVQAPGGNQVVPVSGGVFAVTVPLAFDSVNLIQLVSYKLAAWPSPPLQAKVIQDGTPPTLFVTFPKDGQVFQVTQVDVSGTVSDAFTPPGTIGVTVEGLPATLLPNASGGATFLRSNVTIGTDTSTVLDVVATDQVGNQTTAQLTVWHVSPPSGVPLLTHVAGDDQTGLVKTELAGPLRVKVTKDDGGDLPGKLVTFEVLKSDGGLSLTAGAPKTLKVEATTDALGIATAYWRLGSAAGLGNNIVRATSLDVLGSVIFNASASAGAIAQINVAKGSGQVVQISGTAPGPLEVRVSDGLSGINAVPVTFSVAAGGGLVDGLASTVVGTNPAGRASVVFQTGGLPESQVVTADFGGNPGSPATFVLETVKSQPFLSTSLRGVVLDGCNLPIGGATCTLEQYGYVLDTQLTDALGRFLFDEIDAQGLVEVRVDGSTATQLGGPNGVAVDPGSFPLIRFQNVVLIAKARNRFGGPLFLPRLAPQNAVLYDNAQDLVLTVDGVAGMRGTLSAGSVTHPDGSPVDGGNPILLSFDQVPHDSLPLPLPDGVSSVMAWIVQPPGACFDPPMQLELPNVFGQASNAEGDFKTFTYELGGYGSVASGTVIADASLTQSDPGSGLSIPAPPGNCDTEGPGIGSYCPPFDPTLSIELPDPCFSMPGAIPTTSLLPVSGTAIRDDACGSGAFAAKRGSVLNRGVDISGTPGESVLAVYDGTVWAVQTGCVAGAGCTSADQDCGSGYGNFVILEHDAAAPAVPRFFTAYTQLDTVLVGVGDFVPAGVMMGTLGQTGNANPDCFTGCTLTPFVHFEMSAIVPPLAGKQPRCNPQDYLTSLGTPPGSGAQNPEFSDFDGQLVLSAGGKPGYQSPSLLARFDELPFRQDGLSWLRGTWIVGDTVRELRTPYLSSTPGAVLSTDLLLDDPDGRPVSLTLTAGQTTLTAPGQMTGLVTTATDLFGTPRDVTLRADGTVYRTSNPSIATVGPNGLVTAVSTGQVYLAATNEGRTATLGLEVDLGDPNTTVRGFVWEQDGTPVSGADVTVLPGNLTGTTAADGSFSIAGVPSQQGELVVIADALILGEPKTETVSGIVPVPGDSTDAGILRLNDTVYWDVGVSGNWSVGSNWSGGVAPTGGDHVVIDRPETITVTLDVNIIGALSSLRCHNDLAIGASSRLSVVEPFQVNGVFTLGGPGGKLDSSTLLPGVSGSVVVAGGTLANVTLAADVVFPPAAGAIALTLEGVLTLDGSTITLSGSPGNVHSMSPVLVGASLSGTGEVHLASDSSLNQITSNALGPLVFGEGVTVRGNGTVGMGTGEIINLGTILADSPGTPLVIETAGGFTNQGSIAAESGGNLSLDGLMTNEGAIAISGGGTLTIAGAFTNTGTLTSTSSVVDLAGAFEVGDLGSYSFDGGTVEITGTLSNSSLDITGSTSTWRLNGCVIEDSTLTTGGGQSFEVEDVSTFLDNVTLAGGLSFPAGPASTVRVLNGLTLDGATVTLSSAGNAKYMNFDGTQTLGGTGEVHLATNSNQNRIQSVMGTLTIAPGVTVRGRGRLSSVSGGTFVNQGTLHADTLGTPLLVAAPGWENQGTIVSDSSANMTLQGAAWTNSGSISASGFANLTLGGTFTNTGSLTSTSAVVDLAATFELADLGSYTFTAGNVNISGTLSNSSLDITGTTPGWYLNNGTIVDSTLTATGGQVFNVNGGSNVLDNVVLVGSLDYSAFSAATVTVQNGLTLSSATITMNSPGAGTSQFLEFTGTQTLGGTGEVHFATDSSSNRVRALAGTTLMIGSGVTVRGRGRLEGTVDGTFDIQGTVRAEDAGTFRIASALTVTSSGNLEIDAGATLEFPNPITQTAGTTDLGTSGNLTASGTLDVQGGVLTGSGTITGNVSMAGTIRPGGSGAAGTITILGEYTQTSSGVFEAELGGLTAGTQFDQITGSPGANPTLAGTLEVTLINGFTASPGDEFDVIDNYPSLTGSFSPTFPSDGNTWTISYAGSFTRVNVD